ncbi:MAG TPA: diguanylate cyclase [Anaerolineaceae bacterium]|nr:diguanylate cyclase [Anaerolineaceae bacterium]
MIEIIIVIVGLGITAYLYSLTENYYQLSQEGRAYDQENSSMLLSVSKAYIHFNQFIDGNRGIDLNRDVYDFITRAQKSCQVISQGGPDGRFIPTPDPYTDPTDENNADLLCDKLIQWRELMRSRENSYINGEFDHNREAFEKTYADFVELAKPFDGSAVPHIKNAETSMRQTFLGVYFSLGLIILLLAWIIRRNRGNQEKRLGQLLDEIDQRTQLNKALISEQTLLTTLIHNLPDAIFAKDLQNRFMIANFAIAQKMGVLKPNELIGKTDKDFQPADVAAQILEDEQTIFQTGQPLVNRQEIIVNRTTGDSQCLLTTKVPLHDDQGQVYGLVGISRDITGQKAAEQALQVANQKLTEGIYQLEVRTREMDILTETIDLLQACPDITEACSVISEQMRKFFPQASGLLYLFKPSRNIVERVAAWGVELPGPAVIKPEDCWGLRRGQIHVMHEGETINAQGRAEKNVLICHHITVEQPADMVCLPLVAQGETLGMLHLCHYPESGPLELNPNPNGWTTSDTLQQIDMIGNSLSLALANIKLRSTLHQQSIRDPLTGLYNRRYMEETLERELLRSARSSKPVGMIMIDIDHFKQFNDTFGHQAGDALLVELAQFFRAHIREEDIVCRYGGEEFVLMMPESGLEPTQARAQEICDQVHSLHVQYQTQTLGTISLSLGVAIYPDHGDSAETLILAADRALYRAKLAGRNQVAQC